MRCCRSPPTIWARSPYWRSLRLWWTKPEAYGPDGPQLFHIGARARPVVVRQAKFLFATSEDDEQSGPVTFLPLDISQEIVRASLRMGEESGEVTYALPDDEAGRGDLWPLMANTALARSAKERMRNVLEIWAPWMFETGEAEGFIQHMMVREARELPMTPREVGKHLNVTRELWERLVLRSGMLANTHRYDRRGNRRVPQG